VERIVMASRYVVSNGYDCATRFMSPTKLNVSVEGIGFCGAAPYISAALQIVLPKTDILLLVGRLIICGRLINELPEAP